MQNRVNVDYNNKQSVSDIFTLTNVVTRQSVALIPSDSAGNFSWTGITKAPIIRNAMQTSTTSGEWSDLEYPYMAIPQEDWTGGRANLRFSSDKSRFFDSRRAQTAFNSCIYNAPLEHYSDFYGSIKAVTNCPASITWKKIASNNSYLIRRIEITNTANYGKLYIHLRRRGTPVSGLTVQLLTSMDENATVIGGHTYTTEEITDITAEFPKFTFEQTEIGDDIYLKVFSENSDTENYWEVGCTNVLGETQHSYTGDEWNPVQFDLLFRLDSVDHDDIRYKFFMYEQVMFVLFQDDEDAVHLCINGHIGQATSGDHYSITIENAGWETDQFAGAKIGLVYRNGIEGENTVWKTIESNTADTITISADEPDWDVIPVEGTTFIITDTPYWFEITGHNLADKRVTDIHVIRGVVYIAQGDYEDVKKMRWHNGSYEFQTLTGVYATFLHSVRDTSAMMLYRGRNDDEYHLRSVERSVLLDWETSSTELANVTTAVTTDGGVVNTPSVDFGMCDIDCKLYEITVGTFSSDKNQGYAVIMLQQSEDNHNFEDVQSITVNSDGKHYIAAHCQYRYRRLQITVTGTNGTINNVVCATTQTPRFVDRVVLKDNYGKITKLFEYGSEQEKSLWVFQEGMVSSINKTGTYGATYHLDRINLDELSVTTDEWNGSATWTSDVYLLWSWLNGLQRYYNTQLEGKGPDHDEGMPDDMRGRVTAIVSYPGSFFIAIDGQDGYSSVMMYNGAGWHNLYKAPNKGERIWDIAFQPIYGDRPDRLWVQVGENIIWLAMPSKILYALKDPNAEYTHESVVVSAWITGGMAEVDKLWQSMSIMADYIDGTTCWIEADYQLDDEETWHPIRNLYVKSPQQEEDFAGDDESVNGKKLRYRLRLQTTDIHKTPKVNVVLVKAVGRVDIKYSYGFHFRNIKYKADLTGEYEDIEPYELDLILSTWANELATLRLNSAYKLFDNKRVFLDGLTTNVVYEKGEGYLSQITLTEI